MVGMKKVRFKLSYVLTVLLGLLALVLFVRLWVGPGSLPEIWALESQIEQQTSLNEEQETRNEQLQSEVSGLGNDDAAIEDHARSELGMIKKNETYYQVIMKDQEEQQAPVLKPVPQDGNKNANE